MNHCNKVECNRVKNMDDASVFKSLAPLFFFACAALRCYLEAGVFGSPPFFSYFTLTHHVLWYASAMLGTLLILNLVLKINFSELVLLLYGAALFFLPVLDAYISGDALRLEYLEPDFFEVLKGSLSGAFFTPHNRPQFIEIICIDVGIFGYSLLMKKGVKRAIAAVVSVHTVLTLFGVNWFLGKDGPAVIPIQSRAENHLFFSLIWLFFATLLGQVMLFRIGIHAKKRAGIMVLSGILVWGMAGLLTKALLPSVFVFDGMMALLPFYTLTVLITERFFKKRRAGDHHFFLGQITLLAFQLLVVVPVWVDTLQRLIHRTTLTPFA